jgi:hypothetical protein
MVEAAGYQAFYRMYLYVLWAVHCAIQDLIRFKHDEYCKAQHSSCVHQKVIPTIACLFSMQFMCFALCTKVVQSHIDAITQNRNSICFTSLCKNERQSKYLFLWELQLKYLLWNPSSHKHSNNYSSIIIDTMLTDSYDEINTTSISGQLFCKGHNYINCMQWRRTPWHYNVGNV